MQSEIKVIKKGVTGKVGSPLILYGGRYGIWTHDFHRVRMALSRWVNRPNIYLQINWYYSKKLFANKINQARYYSATNYHKLSRTII